MHLELEYKKGRGLEPEGMFSASSYKKDLVMCCLDIRFLESLVLIRTYVETTQTNISAIINGDSRLGVIIFTGINPIHSFDSDVSATLEGKTNIVLKEKVNSWTLKKIQDHARKTYAAFGGSAMLGDGDGTFNETELTVTLNSERTLKIEIRFFSEE